MNSATLKCLVLSECAVPLPGLRRAEGGGLRAMGLARGLQANADGVFDVSLAHPASGDASASTGTHQGIEVLTWTSDSLGALVRSFDSVIVSYCALELAPAVVAALRTEQQLILDCNVPFYVEVSARGSASVQDEFGRFMVDVPKLATILRRGDLFLCASERQKLYYQGVLSAIGRINPATYGADLMSLVPYGIYDQAPSAGARPIDALTGRPASFKLLWFGSLYPWFDIETLLEAVALLNDRGSDVSLTIVGARNPFSTHPDFLAAFDRFDELLARPRYRAHVFQQPWVDFETRADWYLNADVGVSINRPGLENSLAWRTRLVDMVWAGLPVATNGGDPLGDELLTRCAAVPLDVADAQRMADDLRIAIGRCRDESLKGALGVYRRELTWSRVTRDTAVQIRSLEKAADFAPEMAGAAGRLAAPAERQWQRAWRLCRSLRRHVRDHGPRKTLWLVGSRLAGRLGRRV